MANKKDSGAENRIRLKIKSYDHRLIDASTKQIIDTAVRNGADIIGPIPLPTEIRKYTVNRSTFVHKNARDQFEMRVHKRLIEILNPGQKIVEALSSLSLPSGVDIEIKLIS
jgi:small subunit ribosomal protein S10